MNTEEQSPEEQPSQQENIQDDTPKKSSGLPSIRTFHRDAETARGKKQVDNFTPSKPKEPKQKEVKEKQPTEDEEIPQSASGFVPPKKLHRAQQDKENPERKAPEQSEEKQQAPQSSLEKKPKKSIVHTYEDDANKALKEKGGSVASIAVAEQKRRGERGETRPQPPTRWKKYLVRTITIILFLGGVGVLGYLYLQSRDPGTTTQQQEQAIIFADEIQRQNVSNLTAFELRNTIESFIAEEIPEDTVRELRLTRDIEVEEETVQVALTPDELIARVDLERRAPLARALGDRIMITSVGSAESGSAVIADVSSYDSAFASMIRWEPNIADDLYFLLPPQKSNISTSTETGTPQTGFVDIIIENRDARVLYDENGEIMLLYSFPRTDILVISTSDSVYREVLERLERRTFVR
ncbi:MAG: hypothetical protein WDZ70_00245 [Candidatus Paceibacterota bacterium]